MLEEYSEVAGTIRSCRFDNPLSFKRHDSSIITRAYSTLKSHKQPLALPGISRSSRHISYYDYLPHRKVWSEKDQRQRDRSRRLFRKEVQKELQRQQANEEARDRDMFPPEDETMDTTSFDEGKSYLEQYFPSIRNTRRTSLQSSASTSNGRRVSIQSLHAFFPEIENYDFAPRADRPPNAEKESEKTEIVVADSEDSRADVGLIRDNSGIGSKPSDGVAQQSQRNYRRVTFDLTAAIRSSSSQWKDSDNTSRSDKAPLRRPSVGTGLMEIHETGLIKQSNNISNISKHNSRLNLLHDSIEENMETSRQLNESRIQQRRAKSKSAVTRDKRESYDFIKRANSANVQAINLVYPPSPNFSAQPISYTATRSHNVVITAPHIDTMGVKRR